MPPLGPIGTVTDIAGNDPAGENLENDADFGAMERAARGKPEQQHGTLVVPKVDPDWKEVETLACGLLTRTQDLRILVRLAVARLHLAGLPAFAEVLATIRLVLETRWPAVHPRLDPEDDDDPTLRANALLALTSLVDVLPVLRDLRLAAAKRAGWVTWRDVAIANGQIEAPANHPKLADAVIQAAFQETDRPALFALRDAARTALAQATAIPKVFAAHTAATKAPDLTGLIKQLADLNKTFDRYTPADDGQADAPGDAEPDMTVHVPAAAQAVLGPVSTRADAMRLLDLVLAYYARYEPSSPLPLLLERARRLADMSFIDILRDLAPDGLNQAQLVAGPKEP